MRILGTTCFSSRGPKPALAIKSLRDETKSEKSELENKQRTNAPGIVKDLHVEPVLA